MHKKLVPINLIIWIIVAGFFSIALIACIIRGSGYHNMAADFKFSFGTLKIEKQENISLDNCDKIGLNFSTEDIEVYTTEEQQAKIVEKSSSKLSSKQEYTLSKQGESIEIKEGNKKKLSFGQWNKKLEIYIPKSFNKKLEIKSTTGDIVINNDINLNYISVKQSTGDFDSKGIINSGEVQVKLDTGDIKLNKITANLYNITTTTGDVNIDSLSGSGKVGTETGDIDLYCNSIIDYLKASATTGDVKLNVSKEISFDFYGKCSWGDIDSNFDFNYKNKDGNEVKAKIGQEPFKKIDVSTTTGDIKILRE